MQGPASTEDGGRSVGEGGGRTPNERISTSSSLIRSPPQAGQGKVS